MRITKLGHACVRIEHDGQVLVLDPGSFSEPEAVDGATAVLVTHEHADHLDVEHLRRTDAPVYTIAAVRKAIADADSEVAERVQVVQPGEQLDVGLPVTVVGEKHAVIHPDLPRFDNSGFVVQVGDVRLFHPGDALTPPGVDVDVLLLPVHAPWNKMSEVVDYAREVGAPRSVAVHDGLLNDDGLTILNRNLHGLLDRDGRGYERLVPGTDLTLQPASGPVS
jgi:L-ascorbate metabolism protein UlaG (beta-lactamase superfamily)